MMEDSETESSQIYQQHPYASLYAPTVFQSGVVPDTTPSLTHYALALKESPSCMLEVNVSASSKKIRNDCTVGAIAGTNYDKSGAVERLANDQCTRTLKAVPTTLFRTSADALTNRMGEIWKNDKHVSSIKVNRTAAPLPANYASTNGKDHSCKRHQYTFKRNPTSPSVDDNRKNHKNASTFKANRTTLPLSANHTSNNNMDNDWQNDQCTCSLKTVPVTSFPSANDNWKNYNSIGIPPTTPPPGANDNLKKNDHNQRTESLRNDAAALNSTTIDHDGHGIAKINLSESEKETPVVETIQSHRNMKSIKNCKRTFDEERWMQTFERLAIYKFRNKTTRVPRSYKKDPKLANWVQTQIYTARKGMLRDDRKRLLDSLGFSYHAARQRNRASWETMLQRFEEHQTSVRKNSNISRDIFKKNPALANWIKNNRAAYKKGLITHERKHRLNIAGFEWRLRNEYPWEEMFDRLVAYKESYKNTNVPRIYKKDTKLANWVQTQRGQYKRNALLVYRINRLNGIGFQWKHRYL